jgi:class 3 adenylate cyclase
MPELPSGTVTFLFTDIEGSTALWERDREGMATAVERHLLLLRAAIETREGVLFKVVGDAVQAAFPTAPDAAAAALEAQRTLRQEKWPEGIGPVRVRMALHTAAATPQDGDYLAPV